MPDPAYGLLAESYSFGHAACAPVRGVTGFLLRCFVDHVLDCGWRDCRWPSRSWRVFIQRCQPAVEKPVPPTCCLLGHDSQLGRNLLILHSTSGKQDDPGT